MSIRIANAKLARSLAVHPSTPARHFAMSEANGETTMTSTRLREITSIARAPQFVRDLRAPLLVGRAVRAVLRGVEAS